MTSNNNSLDPEASEETPLFQSTVDAESTEESEIWEEMDRPWPASFERSVSLLSSPMFGVEEVKHFTKSPKPGNMRLADRRLMSTPIAPAGALVRPLTRNKSMDAKTNILSGDINNLNFKQTKEDLRKQAQGAAKYRARILKQQANLTQGGSAMEKKRKDSEGKATNAQCIFNMSNILMGVGLLTLPYTCKVAGTIGGIVAIVCLAFTTWRTSILIGRSLNGDSRPLAYFDDSPWTTSIKPGSSPEARMRKPISGFPDIAREAFGDVGSFLLACVLYFELFSGIGIFLVSMGDHMHTLFPGHPASIYMMGAALISAIPVILLRTARLLSYLSMVGTVATICVVVSVVLSYLVEGDITERIAQTIPDSEPPYHGAFRIDGIPLVFGLVAYCFSGHAIVPSIFCSMERPQDFEKVVNISFAIVFVSCLAVALSGYMMFGDFVLDQVTLSLEENSSAEFAMTILTYLMILTAFSKLTLTMFPLAIGMEEIFAPFLSTERAVEACSILIKVVLLFAALLVAVYVPSFSFLCSMVGMICTMIVSVIFPSAAYLRLFGPKLGYLESLVYWCFMLIGCFVAVVGTVLSVG
ncbi:unnamed protein product [Cylindrotheca closterium]|uniref:Amino acid transporter transmembrane domain-containing protein n=1 Tax=Cylindrotheca closterium TaxID=2856 RepID=A0AAD2CVI9_9STRA|nr:unnamed protein product [Cylindrotheca closterium]